MKLGELLVREGKLSSADVEETLKGQAIFGGRFGTNLVEMGLLDENELAMYLGRKTGVPYARPEQFLEIPPQVIQVITDEVAKKYRVIPLSLTNRKLALAMADPFDFAAIDEISFATGYIVVPHIAPELRIVSALEKYYRVRRELRYISVAGGGRARNRLTPQASPAAAPAAQAAAVPQPAPAAAPRAQAEPEEIDIFELAPLEEVETFSDLEGLGAEPFTPAVASWQAPVAAEPDFSLEGLLRGLTEAPDRQSIGEVVVGYLGRQYSRAALFLVKGDRVNGWVAHAGGKPLPEVERLSIALQEPSVLRTVVESKTHYFGSFPLTPCNSTMLTALGVAPSLNQFLAPLVMMGRVVAILYVEGGSKPLDRETHELLKLLGKVSLAFEILILKNKILAT
ncbi:general secretion pathway protein GspE [Geomonas limicola]|uniref:General secretion pathway protein GspE n=1 Tax=Geomonas limicola TaxID=2740186 RepID=A0A6V8N557_9BACT|nr:general secretion pathway protein [Geomonas limicola]GFO67708.1 general secretion pathway protein GspE [Geomonas limicola]